ncbi:ATP-binding protein [Streptomyces clavuligerus]|uniref:ATP-binding protein n=1 Tax=Streptomyces clavuligerus TaxID=1901 RepID=UPI001E36ABE5|nr:ATP-binding protein [Streptomyces clavuligerus]
MPEARYFVAALLQGWSGVDDAQLVVGELAANAVKHTRSGAPGGSFHVTVVFRDGRVRVVVADQGGGGGPRSAPSATRTRAAGGSSSWSGIPRSGAPPCP